MNTLPDPSIRIGPHHIGRGNPCFIIAEIGTEHEGDPSRAEELIDAASEAGADCVKTQAVFAREILHPAAGLVDLPGGKVSLFRKFLELERDIDFYALLKKRAEEKNLVFLCTPFGTKSAALLRDLGVQAVKIASPELNYYPLLQAASFGVPLILSTGVSTLGDIERALAAVTSPAALLQCITAYPAPPEQYNLSCIGNLARIFGVPTGVSDHTEDPLLVPLVSVACGGCIIEKHMTLERNRGGLDGSFALEPADYSTMVKEVRNLEKGPPEEQERIVLERFGIDTVQKVMGNGVKRLSDAELENYRTSNRSLLALRDLPAGTAITNENTALLRSEKNLEPGLRPDEHSLILGKHLVRDIKTGNGITWSDLLQ